MLLSFTCENIFCFAEETELLATATSDKFHADHLGPKSRRGGQNPLRLIGLYGANGHGKTKFIDAIRILQDFAVGISEEPLKSIKPFRLNSLVDKPSKLQIVFCVNNAEYDYGFVADSERVIKEWLYENRSGQEVLLFAREFSPKKSVYSYEFGGKLRNSKSPSKNVSMESFLAVVATGVSEGRSFLEKCFEHKVTQFRSAYTWLLKSLIIVSADSSYGPLHEKLSTDQDFLEYLNSLIKSSDTGICRLEARNSEVPLSLFDAILPGDSKGISEDINNLVVGETVELGSQDGPSMTVKKAPGDKLEVSRLISVHSSEVGDVDFDVFEESSGTRRLLDLYPMLKIAADEGVTFIVDELDRKLHPLLSYDLIQKFAAVGKGQLIFTTHTTHLLDLAILRRDEVWLMQKDRSGSTKLYSLAEFKVRPDLDIRRGYLQGRFGAIPFLGNAHDLGWLSAS